MCHCRRACFSAFALGSSSVTFSQALFFNDFSARVTAVFGQSEQNGIECILASTITDVASAFKNDLPPILLQAAAPPTARRGMCAGHVQRSPQYMHQCLLRQLPATHLTHLHDSLDDISRVDQQWVCSSLSSLSPRVVDVQKLVTCNKTPTQSQNRSTRITLGLRAKPLTMTLASSRFFFFLAGALRTWTLMPASDQTTIKAHSKLSAAKRQRQEWTQSGHLLKMRNRSLEKCVQEQHVRQSKIRRVQQHR